MNKHIINFTHTHNTHNHPSHTNITQTHVDITHTSINITRSYICTQSYTHPQTHTSRPHFHTFTHPRIPTPTFGFLAPVAPSHTTVLTSTPSQILFHLYTYTHTTKINICRGYKRVWHGIRQFVPFQLQVEKLPSSLISSAHANAGTHPRSRLCILSPLRGSTYTNTHTLLMMVSSFFAGVGSNTWMWWPCFDASSPHWDLASFAPTVWLVRYGW